MREDNARATRALAGDTDYDLAAVDPLIGAAQLAFEDIERGIFASPELSTDAAFGLGRTVAAQPTAIPRGLT